MFLSGCGLGSGVELGQRFALVDFFARFFVEVDAYCWIDLVGGFGAACAQALGDLAELEGVELLDVAGAGCFDGQLDGGSR